MRRKRCKGLSSVCWRRRRRTDARRTRDIIQAAALDSLGMSIGRSSPAAGPLECAWYVQRSTRTTRWSALITLAWSAIMPEAMEQSSEGESQAYDIPSPCGYYRNHKPYEVC